MYRGCVAHVRITKLPRALVGNTSYELVEAPLSDLSYVVRVDCTVRSFTAVLHLGKMSMRGDVRRT